MSESNGGMQLEALLEKILLPPDDGGGLVCTSCNTPNSADVHMIGKASSKKLAVQCMNCKTSLLSLPSS
jgi:hypothetical protein